MFAAAGKPCGSSAFVFLSAPRALKALHYKSAAHSLFPRKPQVCGKLSALIQNVILKRAIDFPRENLGRLLPAIFCDLRTTPTGTRHSPLTAEVFLCAAFFRAHHYRNAAHSPFLHEANAFAKLSALRQKCHFATRNWIIEKIRGKSFEQTKFFRALKGSQRIAAAGFPAAADFLFFPLPENRSLSNLPPNRAPENRTISNLPPRIGLPKIAACESTARFLGRGGAERACEHCPFGAMRGRSRLLRRGKVPRRGG